MRRHSCVLHVSPSSSHTPKISISRLEIAIRTEKEVSIERGTAGRVPGFGFEKPQRYRNEGEGRVRLGIGRSAERCWRCCCRLGVRARRDAWDSRYSRARTTRVKSLGRSWVASKKRMPVQCPWRRAFLVVDTVGKRRCRGTGAGDKAEWL